ncbi:secretion protein [Prevotella pectinovora]|uniref:secretion protein n=1 Tax=Prevotella pectinovora TaxID=1602169 RepID=UPI002FD8AF22
MRKKGLLLMFLMLIATGIYAEDGVVLLLRNGNSVKFAFSEKPVMVMGSTLTMKTTSETVDYNYTEIKRSYFGEITSSIDEVRGNSKSESLFRMTPAGMEVTGLQQGEKVSVYTVGGKLVYSAKSTGSQLNINLPSDRQVYVVKTDNGVSFKINRQ